MSKERESGRKWDGISRVSTNQYKENWEEIFGQKEQEELKASYKQSLANKKERKQKEIEEKLWKRLKDWNLEK
jgi:hypothetical protein